MAKQNRLVLPVVSLGAEYLVMGNLMRRNIMTYKAPPGNEGYDLICIHPDPKKIKSLFAFRLKAAMQQTPIAHSLLKINQWKPLTF